VPGLVHDQSATGATLFIEPMAVVEANNELRTLASEESAEIERILAEFSTQIADFSYQLKNNYNSITEIALYFALSELSFNMNAVAPTFNDNKIISFSMARHPLLDKTKVVPINISIGGSYNMLVITGPNTGGKTVSLKTLGLFVLMAQSGMHLPCENAQMCLFDAVYPDIGDEQSIEQSLSTFSSHMISIVNILNSATESSLILFDELGAGTDPIEGAALAQSILEIVLKNESLCAATTHYAELKAFALDTDGVINASCEFDINTLKPTYRLIIGTPGKSNAFLISQKLGVSDSIIQRANELISDDTRNFESVIQKLESERIELENEKKEAKRLREEYEKFKTSAENELKSKLGRAEKESQAMIEKAREIVTGARASAEFVFDKLDKLQKEDRAYLAARYAQDKKSLRESLYEADKIYNPVDEIDENYVLPRNLKKGDRVILRNLGTKAVLLEDPDKSGSVSVQTGFAKTKTNIKNLMLVTDDIAKKMNQTTTNTIKTPKKKVSSKTFSPSFDVRGQNVEDAWIGIDKYIDEAILVGVKSVTIVHGKGTGKLREGIHNFLKKHSHVKTYRLGTVGEGEMGVTIVELK
jgi:DNA mismatch repair protein MutS2